MSWFKRRSLAGAREDSAAAQSASSVKKLIAASSSAKPGGKLGGDFKVKLTILVMISSTEWKVNSAVRWSRLKIDSGNVTVIVSVLIR